MGVCLLVERGAGRAGGATAKIFMVPRGRRKRGLGVGEGATRRGRSRTTRTRGALQAPTRLLDPIVYQICMFSPSLATMHRVE